MARGKHPAALFEVMNTTRPGPQPGRRGFFAGLTAKLRRGRDASNSAPAPQPVPAPQPAPKSVASAPAAPSSLPTLTPPPATAVDSGDRASGLSIILDYGRREIGFRLSYLSAAICGVALLALLGAFYLLGRSSAPNRLVLTKQSVEEVRSKGSQPDLLKVGSGTPAPTPPGYSGQAPAAGSGTSTPTPAGSQTGTPAPAPDPQASTTFVVEDAQRTVGLNYVVIQSYPTEKMANDARDACVAAGVPCTVEKGLKGWGASWYSVVGIRGFGNRMRGVPEYENYLKQITQVSDRSAGPRSFQGFKPLPYKWGQ